MAQAFNSFSEFYPFYLSEHRNLISRRLHFIGTGLASVLIIAAVLSQQWALILFVPVVGYGSAWIGHFFFEKNKPATFTYPLYSLMGDWVMFKDILTGKIKF